MEIVKFIALGIIIGVVGFSVLTKEKIVEKTKIVYKTVECDEEIMFSSTDNEQNREKINKKELVIVENKKSINIKSPDEIYEEEHKEIEENTLEDEEELSVDRDVISLELEHAEANIQKEKIEIDDTIRPEELQQEELLALTREVTFNKNDTPPLNPIEDSNDEEIANIISDELKDLEEYGDPDGSPLENEIPK